MPTSRLWIATMAAFLSLVACNDDDDDTSGSYTGGMGSDTGGTDSGGSGTDTGGNGDAGTGDAGSATGGNGGNGTNGGNGGNGGEGESGAVAEIDCATETVPTFAEVEGFQKCNTCHAGTITGADRNAPEDITFDSFTDAAAHVEEVFEEVEEGKMPPPNSGITLTAEEKREILVWAECGPKE